MAKANPIMKRNGTYRHVTWFEVEDVQLQDWLLATPAQRLAWLEEMLEFARMAGALPSVDQKKVVVQPLLPDF